MAKIFIDSHWKLLGIKNFFKNYVSRFWIGIWTGKIIIIPKRKLHARFFNRSVIFYAKYFMTIIFDRVNCTARNFLRITKIASPNGTPILTVALKIFQKWSKIDGTIIEMKIDATVYKKLF